MDSYAAVFSLGAAAIASSVAWALASRARREAEARTASALENERLLRSIFDSTAGAIVLISDAGRVIMENPRARDMFADGQELAGQNFLTLLGKAPEAFREAMLGNEDALFTLGAPEGEAETFHLTKRQVTHGGVPHTLVVVEQVTREIRRQEVEIWKKLIRTISHELNNSLAPISSTLHSARLILDKPEHMPKLVRVFDTIEDRTKHLQEFIEGYVKFARLPKPRLAPVEWEPLLDRIKNLYGDITVEAAPSQKGWLDQGQIEQVLINLVKNALEAGSPPSEIILSIVARERGAAEITILDRGSGMSKEVLANALLPFYSTKDRGTGLGLALCREIVEAHGGKIRIANREGKGSAVTLSLPGREAPDPQAITVRLSLTRA